MLKCIAIDDEPLALRQLTGYIAKIPYLELVATCNDAIEAQRMLAERKVDLIFVDINMPDLNGVDFVRALSERPMVIFTTAYSEYAIEGFKLDAVDYLLKPFSFADFSRSAAKAQRSGWRTRSAAQSTFGLASVSSSAKRTRDDGASPRLNATMRARSAGFSTRSSR